MSVPRRTTLAGRAASLGVAALLALGAAGCTESATPAGSPAASPEAQPSSVPLAAYGADGPPLTLQGPCTDLAADVVADALGADVETSLTWAPGQRLPGSAEVADEYGCRHGAGDVTASAWVFATPTSRGQARRLVREAAGPGCRREARAETFGDPGVAFRCDGRGGPGARRADPRAGLRGLVGTSWVSCEIAGTDDQERVARWCTAVLESLSRA